MTGWTSSALIVAPPFSPSPPQASTRTAAGLTVDDMADEILNEEEMDDMLDELDLDSMGQR